MLAQSGCSPPLCRLFCAPPWQCCHGQKRPSRKLSPTPAAVADKFALVHNSLLQHTLEYFKNIMAATGFLLLAIGWLLTSGKARSFLAEHRRARNLMLIALWTVAVLDSALTVGAAYIRTAPLRLLERLACIDRVYLNKAPYGPDS